MDGNFTAQHEKMRRPEDDVSLSDGCAIMVSRAPYHQHLADTKESRLKSKCSKHKAVDESVTNRNNLEATGVGGAACARHGCFVPHSMVDFQKGEQYEICIIEYSIADSI